MSSSTIPKEYFEPYLGLQTIPSNEEEIYLLFEELVRSMNLSDEEINSLQSYSIEEKRSYLEERYSLMSEIPSPECVLKCLNISINSELFSILSFNLTTQPTSWTNRFLKANGLSFLEEQIDAILRNETSQNVLTSTEFFNSILKIFCEIADKPDGSKELLKLKDLPRKLIKLSSVNNPLGVILILTILRLFIINHEITIEILVLLDDFCNKEGFQAFSSILLQNNLGDDLGENIIRSILKFFNCILKVYSKDLLKLIDFSLKLDSCQVIYSLKEFNISSSTSPSLYSKRETFLEKIQIILDQLSEMFQDYKFNPFDQNNVQEIVRYFYPDLIDGIFLNLIDFSIHFKERSTEVVNFVFNFLQLYRHYLSIDPNASIFDVCSILDGFKGLYIPEGEFSDISINLMDKTKFADSQLLSSAVIDIIQFPSIENKPNESNDTTIDKKKYKSLVHVKECLVYYVRSIKESKEEFKKKEEEFLTNTQILNKQVNELMIERNKLLNANENLSRNLNNLENELKKLKLNENPSQTLPSELSGEINELKKDIDETKSQLLVSSQNPGIEQAKLSSNLPSETRGDNSENLSSDLQGDNSEDSSHLPSAIQRDNFEDSSNLPSEARGDNSENLSSDLQGDNSEDSSNLPSEVQGDKLEILSTSPSATQGDNFKNPSNIQSGIQRDD